MEQKSILCDVLRDLKPSLVYTELIQNIMHLSFSRGASTMSISLLTPFLPSLRSPTPPPPPRSPKMEACLFFSARTHLCLSKFVSPDDFYNGRKTGVFPRSRPLLKPTYCRPPLNLNWHLADPKSSLLLATCRRPLIFFCKVAITGNWQTFLTSSIM
jgi:hypothetical protein